MPPQIFGAEPLATEALELLQRLRQKSNLWTYVARSGQTTTDSVVGIIDSDSRVGRGEFVLGVVDGHFDTLVCTGRPASIRKLPTLAVPFDVPFPPPGLLQPLPWREAEAVWIRLLTIDRGLAKFVENGLAGAETQPGLAELFHDPKRRLQQWHRAAIERAIALANTYNVPFDDALLFAAFLREAQLREKPSTLTFLLDAITDAGHTLLELAPERVHSLDPPERTLFVSGEMLAFLNGFVREAHRVRKDTDETEDIRTRHVATAFLHRDAIVERLKASDVSLIAVRQGLFEIVTALPGADRTRWRKTLGLALTAGTTPAGLKTPESHAQQTSQPQPQPQPQPAPAPAPAPREFSIDTIVSRDTWTTDDNLGYGLYAQAITASILNRTAEPPLTIGIQAPWGQGKTSLMRMMQDELDPGAPHRDRVAHSLSTASTAIQTTYVQLLQWMRSTPERPGEAMLNETRQKTPAHWPVDEKKKPVDPTDERPRIPTVWFNPLYYRETQQVWAGMAHAILQQLADRFEDPLGKEKFWFRLQQSRLNVAAVRRDIHAWVLMRLVPTGFLLLTVALLTAIGIALAPDSVVTLLKAAGGVAAVGTLVRFLIEFVRKIDRPFERYVTEPNYQNDLGPLHLIDHDLDRALRLLVGDKPIAVFIDDLDRCDPQTVNNVILAINQFLSLPRRNVFFILGMDMEMVAAALEQAQKEQFGGAVAQRRSFGWRFMEKFVQLPFFIPHLDAGVAQQFAESHLGGAHRAPVAAAAPPQIVEQAMEKLEKATTPSAVGEAMAEAAATLPPQEQATLQKEASNKVAELMKTNDSEEMKEIARIAVQDLDLNPRTIVRYFGLVRVLRNIQVSTGNVTSPEADRTLVLRAAHLLMNWPQFVQWLRNEPEIHTAAGAWKLTVEEVERLAGGQSMKRWQQGMAALMRRDAAPPHLVDPSLYRFLRKIAAEPPGLKAMYDARMF